MAISRLPTELQEFICSLVGDQRDLISVSLASTQLNHPAERFLYRAIHIKSIRQARRFEGSIKRRGRANHVRDFILDVYDPDFAVYGWAIKQLPDSRSGSEAYFQGLQFNTDILSIFPRLHTLRIYAQHWPSQAIGAERWRIPAQNALNTLRSCSLAFKLPEDQLGDPHWDLSPWNELLRIRTLESLNLIRAEGDAESPFEDANKSLWACRTNLKSLRLLCCHLTHNWLSMYLRFPLALKELEVVVTTEKAARFAEHMFLEQCSCMEPLTKSLETLSYVNLRTIPPVHRAHHFAMFTQLKELTASATELFGDASRGKIETVLQSLTLSMPPTLQILRLYVHRTDIFGDTEGYVEGAFKVLHDLLKPKNIHRVPVLSEIILHVYIKDPKVPSLLISQAEASGVKVRLATMEEIIALRERLQLRLLMF